MTEANSRFRLTVVGLVVFALFSALFARLWFLQVGNSTSYAAQTERNRIRVIREPAVRGTIVDRNGKVLVQNTLVDTITVKRGLTPQARKITVQNLARVLAVTPKSIEKELDSPKYSVYEPVPIAQKATYETLVYISEHPELFPGVKAERRSIREYPNRLVNGNPVGAHLLGYVALINKHEYKIHKSEGYTPNDYIGKQGVEQLFESELRGRPRERRLEVDSRGRLVGEASEEPPTPGHDVQLTVDLDVQRVAENALDQGMKLARNNRDLGYRAGFRTYKASGGAVVVMDAQSGDIVALASAPTYDISKFTTGIPFDEFARLTDPNSPEPYPLVNRAVQGQYAPGSTFKAFSAYAALRDKLQTGDGRPFDDQFTFYDRGFIEFRGGESYKQEFQNAGRRAYGIVDLPKALTVSSDTFFYNIGLLYWQNFGRGNEAITDENHPQYGLQRVARMFGFGRPTGIGLPGEAKGRIPTLQFKQQLNADNPDESSRIWLPGDAMNLAVGQGDLLVTPLQLAVAYGALANGGTLYQPRLAKRILEGGSTLGEPVVIRDLSAAPARKIDLDPALVAPIIKGLEGAVCNDGGTAYLAFADYPCGEIMGKTGTAEIQAGKQDTALFVGVTPPRVDPSNPRPQYVVVVVVEEGGFGGSVAAPIARRVIDALKGEKDPGDVKVLQASDD